MSPIQDGGVNRERSRFTIIFIRNLSYVEQFRLTSDNLIFRLIFGITGCFSAANIDGETFLTLKRDDLLELMPEVEHFKTRKSLLKYIEEMCTGNEVCEKTKPTPSTSANFLLSSHDKVQNLGSPLISCTQIKFPIYSEPGMEMITHSQVEMRNKLIRNTITSMRSLTNSLENREPTNPELVMMAKALVERYPSLKDNRTLNPDKPHEGILMLLKRRLSNIKPVKKRQGPCPTKGKKKLKFDHNPVTEEDQNPGTEDDQNPVTVSEEENLDSEPLITDTRKEITLRKEEEDMAKHYNQLNIKMKEKKPNPKIISQLLNLERKSRRNFIESLGQLKPAQKVDSILKAYPCFTNPVHLLEEMQRELDQEAPFLAECSQRMASYWEQIYIYGIMSNLMPLPEKFCNSDEKAETVLLNLSQIFPGMKKNVPLALEIGDEADINVTMNKLNRPFIIITKSGLFITMCNRIFSKLEKNSYTRAILVYVALFYTFRMEYIPGQENAMLFLQKYVLLDNIHEKECGKFMKNVKKFIEFVDKK